MFGFIWIFQAWWRSARRIAGNEETRVLAVVFAILVLVGTFFYKAVEDLSTLDSLYFTVITLTTVGYGDISPQTAAGKIFTMLYVLLGVGIVVSFVTVTAQSLIDGRGERREEARAKVESFRRGANSIDSDDDTIVP